MLIKKNTEDDNEKIHHMIQEYNSSYMCDSGDFSCHIEENGQLVAGIVAEAAFDTLEVEFLCVREPYRKKGYGRALLGHVENMARDNGIKRVILNTYSFQAPDFYRSMGYTELFCIDPCFKDSKQYYFIKHL